MGPPLFGDSLHGSFNGHTDFPPLPSRSDVGRGHLPYQSSKRQGHHGGPGGIDPWYIDPAEILLFSIVSIVNFDSFSVG